MKILLINIAHPAIGSRIPDDHLPPFGLLCIAGSIIDDGHEVKLFDCDLKPINEAELLRQTQDFAPDIIMFGHSGSSTAQPIISKTARLLKFAIPQAKIVYGGVHPTYFWRELLATDFWLDYVVRGEGEKTARDLIRAIDGKSKIEDLRGISYRDNGRPKANSNAEVILDLDEFRIGWELIDFQDYSYWGGKRAVVIQFSRGCPHLCTYCGQRGFWSKWRHRDPQKLADEIAHLNRNHGVEVFNFADENPSSGRKAWRRFLEAIIAHNLNITLVGSTRADDIVRDKEFLHLYKKAGFERFLLGMENTDEATLQQIKKGATKAIDKEAIRLLRQHNILSMATWVAGFNNETDADLWRGLKQIIEYDPDQIQALYAVPHRWTPFYDDAKELGIIEIDKTKWDYKHQIIKLQNIPPWRLFMWVKFIEVCAQARPKAIARLIWNKEPKIRHAIRWYYKMGRRVWIHEILEFIFSRRHSKTPQSVMEFYGPPQVKEEYASSTRQSSRI